MAQNEMMLRLLKDGKIVGYESRTTTGSRTPLMAIHHKRYITDTGRDITKYLTDRVNYIDHDSFELGIKDGDEWIFGEFIMNNQKKAATFGLYRFEKSSIHDNPDLLKDK